MRAKTYNVPYRVWYRDKKSVCEFREETRLKIWESSAKYSKRAADEDIEQTVAVGVESPGESFVGGKREGGGEGG